MNTTPPAARAPGGMPASGGSSAVLVGLVGIVVGFVVGYGVGRVSTGTPVNPLAQKGGYQEGYEAARLKLKESGLIPDVQRETTTLAGRVVSVGGDSLVFEPVLRSSNPLDEMDAPAQRKVRVTADTKILMRSEKTPAEFQEEADALRVTPPAPGADAPLAPSPFVEKAIGLKDIPVGGTVAVVASVDIFSAAEFDALTITLLPMPAAQPALAPPASGVPSAPGP